MKYTLVEFIAARESEDFDKLEVPLIEWAQKLVGDIDGIHEGDCTKQPHTCMLCLLETLLDDYRQYSFNELKWREDNGV